MKKTAKSFIAKILGWQVRRLTKKHHFQVVGVAGSVGKTSTKLAIAKVLSRTYKVQYQDGNYNDIVSVPLIFFGQQMPSLFNPFAWVVTFWRNEKVIRQNYPYDIVVVEVGTDAPGQISKFKSYLKLDIAVLTAITPEHMEYFAGLDAVAAEELTIASFSTLTLANKDACAAEYLADIKGSLLSYAINQDADFRIKNIKFSDTSCDFEVYQANRPFLKAKHELISEPQLYSVLAAVAVGEQLGMAPEDIEKGLHNIKPVSGRMQRLKGVNNSTIIDDTYNASPHATVAALNTLYRIEAPQKIAVLGNMNELGGYSQLEHQKIGEHCDPRELDLVVTIGPDANKFLAPAAEAKGCQVKTFDNPYSVGKYLKPIIKPKAAILIKGSQNRVFAEETTKLLLADPKDADKLVRQTDYWMKRKRKSFSR